VADGGAQFVVAGTDESVCELLARVVEAAGHSAVRITDASAVVGAVLREGADAVLLDLGAANLDAVKALRGQGEPLGTEVRIAAIEVGPASARLAWQEGADVVLTRPFAASEIGGTMAAALRRSAEERQAERQARLAQLSA
jgi:DNA-binding response OmpR family regulator